MPVFQQIINAGVIIVTLQDGKRWSQEELRENPFRILESLMGMIRANEESEVKSRRLKAAWERKRANIVEVPLTARVRKLEQGFKGLRGH
jgi:DNA invertase Pin-like site-specific DNA recombinase